MSEEQLDKYKVMLKVNKILLSDLCHSDKAKKIHRIISQVKSSVKSSVIEEVIAGLPEEKNEFTEEPDGFTYPIEENQGYNKAIKEIKNKLEGK